MKKRLPDLDPPPRRHRAVTPQEKQIFEAVVRGEALPSESAKASTKSRSRVAKKSSPIPAPLRSDMRSDVGKAEHILDLHGRTQHAAHALVQRFIERAQQQGIRVVRIITGKGRAPAEGVLRKELPRWLEETALRTMIIRYDTATPREGGAGALIIRIRKLKE